MILRENYFDFSMEISDLGYPELKISLRKYLYVRSLLTHLTCFYQELPKIYFGSTYLWARSIILNI